MRYSNIAPCVLWLIIKVCKGVTTVDLQFTNNNCDEEERKTDENKIYNLTWNGQITPKLCSFFFNSGNTSANEVCFESLIYKIRWNMESVEVKISNYSRSWTYSDYHTMITLKCVTNAYRMVVSILIPIGYTEPSPKEYLQLVITGRKVVTQDSDQESTNPISTAVGVTLVILAGLIMFGCFTTEGKLCKLFCDKLKCCGEFVRCCVTCQCLRECSCLSCDDCNCNDICRPCGECCITWAGCCTTLVSRADGNSAVSHSDNVATEMSAIPEASGSTAAITSVSDFEEPPPSYNSINDVSVINDTSLPPPSYDDVTGKTVPTAPPLSEYYKKYSSAP